MDSDLTNPLNIAEADQPSSSDNRDNAQTGTSRVYSTSRLRSFHGYCDDPPVNTSLDFRLPVFSTYHSCIVKIGARQYLIWSPNSVQDPYYPGPDASTVKILKLRGIKKYEQAVDDLTEAQRESNEVLPADDRYLGVWINDAQKDDCNWYLLQGALPCFIIQELPEAEQRHEEASENFFQLTEIQSYVYDTHSCEYDQIALRSRYGYTNTEYNLVLHASPLLNLSLWIDLATEAPLMKRRTIIGGLHSPSLTVAGMEFAKKTRELQDKVLRAKAGSETNVQLGGSEVSINPARAPWMRAPEIIQSGPGPWTTFWEHLGDDSDEPFMLQLGQRSDE
ncbi:hypothetical protein C8F04DRAFT_1282728 [Mycena alexandri]|uniref:Uncharacterized protein n=1 Tax=Mycena alexandri TaxID=1745969 RepID=A0AAD6RVL3_9AGAR|nr:hypothetical protein C8F04DRAFT_1282728 [Mycena alexandri]